MEKEKGSNLKFFDAFLDSINIQVSFGIRFDLSKFSDIRSI